MTIAASSPRPDSPETPCTAERLTREFDWASTSMGPMENWSPTIRTAVSIMLKSTVPMVTLWGEDGVMVYNDAYAVFAGTRHPQLFGSRVREGWPEVADFNDRVVKVGLSGGTLAFKDQSMMLNRRNGFEQVWMNLDYSPICDERGVPVGVIAIVIDVSERFLADMARDAGNRRLRSVTDALPVLIADIGPDGVFRFVNRHWETWFGRSAEQIVGLTPEELVGEAAYEPYRKAVDRALAGEVVIFDGQLPSVGGTRECEVQFLPRYSGSGELEGITALAVDLTERKAAQEAQRRHEERFRLLTEAIPGFIFTATPEGGIDYVGRDWVRYTGADEKASKGSNWIDFVHPDDRERSVREWMRSMETGELFEIEYRLRQADTRFRWWLTRALPGRSVDGSIGQWIGVSTDIHQIVEARQTLARSNEELEREVTRRTRERDRVWNNSRDLIAVLGVDGVFREISPAWTMLLGHDPTEVVGRSFREFVHPEDIAITGGVVTTAIEAPATSFENRYLHKDGTVRWISWHTSTDGDVIYAYGRDITEQKQAARELAAAQEALRHSQKMEAVGQLTGGIAHDFNNLLAGIGGSLEMLEKRIAEGRIGELKRLIGIAQGSTQRAAALTQRLLAFARRQTLDPKPVDVNRMIHGMDELIRRSMGPDVQLEVVGAGGLWLTLADSSQLENALLNLCINARDAMAPAGGRVTIETANKWLDHRSAGERELSPGQYVSLCVTDTGSGMSPEVVERAFDPFFTTKPLGRGTGLGLSMVYGFARQSGGQVRIYSEVGKGTTLCIYLPRYFGVGELPEEEPAPEAQPGASETVLLVDDEEGIRMVTGEILRDCGYHVIEAADGPAALRVLQSDARIDLLVTDVGLPGGMNGRQVADAGRVARPTLKVLFITGYAENAVVGNGGLDARMEVLTKPFTLASLTTRVRQLVDG